MKVKKLNWSIGKTKGIHYEVHTILGYLIIITSCGKKNYIVKNQNNFKLYAEVDTFEEAFGIYDNSPFLKERFARKDIKLLLTCEYIG